MGACDHPGCDGDSSLDNACSYCGDQFCRRHRLPERHDCPALVTTDTLGPDFRDVDLTDDDGGARACKRCGDAPRVFGEEYCEDCLERQVGRDPETVGTAREPDVASSPDVATDGSVAREQVDGDELSDGRRDGLALRDRVWYAGLVTWIRVRRVGWRAIQVAAIGIFLTGVLAVWTAYRHTPLDPVTFLGHEVPAVGGLDAFEVLLYGGIVATVGGVALAMRVIVGRASPR